MLQSYFICSICSFLDSSCNPILKLITSIVYFRPVTVGPKALNDLFYRLLKYDNNATLGSQTLELQMKALYRACLMFGEGPRIRHVRRFVQTIHLNMIILNSNYGILILLLLPLVLLDRFVSKRFKVFMDLEFPSDLWKLVHNWGHVSKYIIFCYDNNMLEAPQVDNAEYMSHMRIMSFIEIQGQRIIYTPTDAAGPGGALLLVKAN